MIISDQEALKKIHKGRTNVMPSSTDLSLLDGVYGPLLVLESDTDAVQFQLDADNCRKLVTELGKILIRLEEENIVDPRQSENSDGGASSPALGTRSSGDGAEVVPDGSCASNAMADGCM